MVFLMRSSMVVSHWSRREMESYSFTFRDTWGGMWGDVGRREEPRMGEELGGMGGGGQGRKDGGRWTYSIGVGVDVLLLVSIQQFLAKGEKADQPH